MAPALNAKVVDSCCYSPFTILCDGGNDKADKYFGIMVRYWNNDARQTVSSICKFATAESLFNALNNELESCDIPWENVVVGYVSDTANVMGGKHNSIIQF